MGKPVRTDALDYPVFCTKEEAEQVNAGNFYTVDTHLAAVRERLAEYAHDAWAGWMRYQFEKGTLTEDGDLVVPKWAYERWTRQMNTRYKDLPGEEKKSDRNEADKIIDILSKTK